jgi:hypothetical protein
MLPSSLHFDFFFHDALWHNTLFGQDHAISLCTKDEPWPSLQGVWIALKIGYRAMEL